MPESFTSLLSHIEELIDAGRQRDARRLLAQFVERKRVDGRLLPMLAGLYLRLGKPEQALGTMQRAMQEIERTPELHNSLGLLFATLGREQESREQFEKALDLDHDNPEALRNLAFTLHRAGERADAYRLLVRCYHAVPLSIELRLICGALLELDGKYPDAVNCYREVADMSTMGEQVNLATQRLLSLKSDNVPAYGFETVVEHLEYDAGVAEAERAMRYNFEC